MVIAKAHHGRRSSEKTSFLGYQPVYQEETSLPSRKHDVIVMAAVLQTIVRWLVSFAPVTCFSD